jgi:hypothetical protein
MLNDPWQDTTKPRRNWVGRRFVVETFHPTCGWLTRGTIRPVDVAETTEPGLAGHLVWRLTPYDHEDLGQVTGDYVTAEKALLDATTALED